MSVYNPPPLLQLSPCFFISLMCVCVCVCVLEQMYFQIKYINLHNLAIKLFHLMCNCDSIGVLLANITFMNKVILMLFVLFTDNSDLIACTVIQKEK